MPSELKLQQHIPGISAQDYYRVVLSNDQLVQRFHKDVNGDPNASATPWEGGKRSVSFNMTLNMPAMIKKLIGEQVAAYFGTECIRVVEVSTLKWLGDSSFELVSEPCLDFPAANKFSTSGVTKVSDAPQGGCQVECTMRCSAALPWPMQSSVEAAMMAEGKATLSKYLDYTKQACEEDLNNRAAAPPPPPPGVAAGPAAAAAPPQGEVEEGEGEEEEFFDVEMEEGEGVVALAEPLTAEEVALRCLLQIQRSGAESAALLREVLEVLRSVDASIAAMHAKVLPAQPAAARAAAASAAAAAAAAAAVQPPTSASHTSFSHKYMFMLCLGLAGASAAAVVYVRAKSRSSH